MHYAEVTDSTSHLGQAQGLNVHKAAGILTANDASVVIRDDDDLFDCRDIRARNFVSASNSYNAIITMAQTDSVLEAALLLHP